MKKKQLEKFQQERLAQLHNAMFNCIEHLRKEVEKESQRLFGDRKMVEGFLLPESNDAYDEVVYYTPGSSNSALGSEELHYLYFGMGTDLLRSAQTLVELRHVYNTLVEAHHGYEAAKK